MSDGPKHWGPKINPGEHPTGGFKGRGRCNGGTPKGKKKVMLAYEEAKLVHHRGMRKNAKTTINRENALRVAERIKRGFGVGAALKASGVKQRTHSDAMRKARLEEEDAPAWVQEYAGIINEALALREERSVTIVMESEDPKVHLEVLARTNPDDWAPAAQRLKIGRDMADLQDEDIVMQLVDAVEAIPDDDEHKRALFERLKKTYEPQNAALPVHSKVIEDASTTGEE